MLRCIVHLYYLDVRGGILQCSSGGGWEGGHIAAWELPGATCTWTPELPSPGFTPCSYTALQWHTHTHTRTVSHCDTQWHTVLHTHTHTVAVHGAGQVYGSQLAGNNSSPDPTPACSSNSSQNLYNLQFPRFSTWSFLDININQWLYLLTGGFPLKVNGG